MLCAARGRLKEAGRTGRGSAVDAASSRVYARRTKKCKYDKRPRPKFKRFERVGDWRALTSPTSAMTVSLATSRIFLSPFLSQIGRGEFSSENRARDKFRDRFISPSLVIKTN